MHPLLALTIAAAAQNASVPGVPHGVTVDGFTVSLVDTDDRDGFFRAWMAGSAALPVTGRAVRGRPLAAVVIFEGCRAGADGNCHVTGRFTYVRPDGSVYGEIDSELWSSPPSRNGSALPSPGGPDLVVDPEDPMGTWTLRVRVTDAVRGATVDAEARIVVDTPPAAAPR
jgi:hypothetical protein